MCGDHGRTIEVRNTGVAVFASLIYSVVAYRSTQYLEKLIDIGVIVPEPSQVLDKLYLEHAPSKTESKSQSSNLLLTHEAIPTIQTQFDLSGSATGDIYRAIEQARQRTVGSSGPK